MLVLREESIVCWLVNREDEEAGAAAIGWLADGERTRIEPTPQEEYARRVGT